MSKIKGVGDWAGYGGWWGGRCARPRLPRGVMSPNLPAVFYDKGLRVKGLFCRRANSLLTSCVLLLNASVFAPPRWFHDRVPVEELIKKKK